MGLSISRSIRGGDREEEGGGDGKNPEADEANGTQRDEVDRK